MGVKFLKLHYKLWVVDMKVEYVDKILLMDVYIDFDNECQKKEIPLANV